MMEGRDFEESSMVFSMETTPRKFQEFHIIQFPDNMRETKFDVHAQAMRLRRNFLDFYNPKNLDDYF